jgi:hypothetical protein
MALEAGNEQWPVDRLNQGPKPKHRQPEHDGAGEQREAKGLK